MMRFNTGYGYSQKYQTMAQQLPQQRQQINEKTKKLCIENKKRRRQFEERQRIHERNEQKRREEALSSRRRRQQEATNAYKAALSKELNKRNRAPSSRLSSASSAGSSRRHIYRSPTVDEVLSNIRGYSVGGGLRTYGESSNVGVRPSSSAPPNFTSPTYTKRAISYTSGAPTSECKITREPESYTRNVREPETYTRSMPRDVESYARPSSGPVDNIRATLDNAVRKDTPQMMATAVFSKPMSALSNDSLTDNAGILADNTDNGPDNTDIVADSLEDFSGHMRETAGIPHHVNRDPDRIRVQIDLTKFDTLDVSDCESADEQPIESYITSRDTPDKHTESYTDLSNTDKRCPVQLLQSDHIASRSSDYFGSDEYTTPLTRLTASTSEPNVYMSNSHKVQNEDLRRCVSHVGVFDDTTDYTAHTPPNYTIHSNEGESFIYAPNSVEAVKVASQSTRRAWGGSDSITSGDSGDNTPNLKSVIRRTPSAKKKQVRWDSVSALDDETMEVDQFDISAEGEAVFTRQYAHPTRIISQRSPQHRPSYEEPINLQRTPTDAEINALWNKVRTTLHRNQAWDTPPQSKPALPHRISSTQAAYNRRNEPGLKYDKVYGSDRYKFNKRPTKSPTLSNYGPSSTKLNDVSGNGHTMLSMEEQRILQSLERLDAKLHDKGVADYEPRAQTISYSSPSLEICRTPIRNETYKRLLNRKTA